MIGERGSCWLLGALLVLGLSYTVGELLLRGRGDRGEGRPLRAERRYEQRLLRESQRRQYKAGPPEIEGTLAADKILGDPSRLAACGQRRDNERALTREAQARIEAVQDPPSCRDARFLRCLGDLPASKQQDRDATVHAPDRGMGLRMMYYGRCLSMAVVTNRTAVLEGGSGSAEILSLYKPWTKCMPGDVRAAERRTGGVVDFDPSYDAGFKAGQARAGTHIVPRDFARKGPFWWKAQELHYLLRPTQALEKEAREGSGLPAGAGAKEWGGEGYAGVHKRVRVTPQKGKCSYGTGECFVPGFDFKLTVGQYVGQLSELQPLSNGTRVYLATDGVGMEAEIAAAEALHGVRVVQGRGGGVSPDGKRYSYSRADALHAGVDLLLLSRSNPLAVSWTSYFGVMAVMLKMVRDDFCSQWVTIDYPPFKVPERAFLLRWPHPSHLASGGLCYLQTSYGHVEDLEGVGGDPNGMHCVVAGPQMPNLRLHKRIQVNCLCGQGVGPEGTPGSL